MDSLDKRIRFLEETAEEMHIKNIRAVHMRAEEGGKRRKLRETFDVVTARAVKSLPVLLEWTIPYVKVGDHGRNEGTGGEKGTGAVGEGP